MLGFATEPATIESEEPLRADGLTQAISAALAEAGIDIADLDFRITDVSGEQYAFKEASPGALPPAARPQGRSSTSGTRPTASARSAPRPCPACWAWRCYAARKHYAPGPAVLGHLGNDDGKRAAIIMHRP